MGGAVGGPGLPVRRSWPQRLLIAFNLAVMTAFLVGAGGLGYAYRRLDQIPHEQVDGLAATPEEPCRPQNFLLVGTDTRELAEEAPGDEGFGGVSASAGTGLSDTMIVARVDACTDRAAMVSFPRDLWVEIPGVGPKKMNEAFRGDTAAGVSGPELLVATIKQDFGIDIHHYVQVDLHGFQHLVEAIGGVTVHLPTAVRDWDRLAPGGPINLTGLDLPAGCIELNGDQALKYVRSRHVETQTATGGWVPDGRGDLGRNERQQDLIRRAADKVLREDLFNPVRLNDLIGVAVKNLRLSSSVDVHDLVRLAKGFRSLTAENLARYELPTAPSTHGKASTVDFIEGREAEREAILDVFRGVDPPAPDPTPAPSGPSAAVGSSTAPSEPTTTTLAPPPC